MILGYVPLAVTIPSSVVLLLDDGSFAAPRSNSFQNPSTPFMNFDLPEETAFAPPDMALEKVFRSGAKFCFNCKSRRRLNSYNQP